MERKVGREREVEGEREVGQETETERDRQTDRRTDRGRNRKRDRQKERERQRERERDREGEQQQSSVDSSHSFPLPCVAAVRQGSESERQASLQTPHPSRPVLSSGLKGSRILSASIQPRI